MQITDQKVMDLYSWLLYNKDYLKIEMLNIDKSHRHYGDYIYDNVMKMEFDRRLFEFKSKELRYLIMEHNSEFSMQELRYMIYDNNVQSIVREILLP